MESYISIFNDLIDFDFEFRKFATYVIQVIYMDQNEDSKLYCYIIIELYLRLCDDDDDREV